MFRLRIKNFQAIRSAEIHFAGFTTLIGESNRGKSAVMRALRVVFQNGFHLSYITRGELECVLSVEFDVPLNGVSLVEFTRSKTVNQYRVVFDTGVEQLFPKVGTGVPEPVLGLGFSPMESDRGDAIELNFQAQLSNLFLLSESPVVFTTFLNQVFDVALYEQALRGMASDMGELTRRYNGNGLVLVEKRRELGEVSEELLGLREREARGVGLYESAGVLNERLDRLTAARDAYLDVDRLCGVVRDCDVELVGLNDSVVWLGKLCEVFGRLHGLRSLGVGLHILDRDSLGFDREARRQNGVANVLKGLHRSYGVLGGVREGLAALSKLDREYEGLVLEEKRVRGLDGGVLGGIEVLLGRLIGLRGVMGELVRIEGELGDYSVRVGKGELFMRELESGVLEYRSGVGICPICASPMGGDVCVEGSSK